MRIATVLAAIVFAIGALGMYAGLKADAANSPVAVVAAK